MSIKSDHWIRRQAVAGMIEPFEAGQVREVDGRRIVSYGTSSYGYDVRCANEFKIFTNINSTIVDPKAFDPQSFVDITADVCIIPPNSFALARTVEYFRIPRSTLTVCVGKSTYARCFSGDTRVALANGTSASLEDMTRRAEQGEVFFGYSIGAHGRLIVTQLEAPRYIGRDLLLEIELDDGAVIRATPDHLFLTRDGRMVPAGDLRPNDSLMPLYRHLWRGYEMVYQPLNGHLHPTHRLADEWNVRNGIYADQPGSHRHHIDFNRVNNYPTNIVRMAASDHIRLHNGESYGEDFDPVEHSAAIRQALAKRNEDPAWREAYRGLQSERAAAFWNDDRYAESRARLLEARLHESDETRERKRAAALRRYQDPAQVARHALAMVTAWAGDDGSRREKQREIARQINIRADIDGAVVEQALREAGSIRGAARLLGVDRSVFRRFPEIVARSAGRRVRDVGSERYAVLNHKVASVRPVAGDHDVYCLTVPEAGNFALEAGVFVHNCGIIVNVTPLEPEWEGHVTLEFSNTTPLPAKIYANEGVAQMLFFESDEVCDTSYKDRSGKYQGQRGVTLPKT